MQLDRNVLIRDIISRSEQISVCSVSLSNRRSAFPISRVKHPNVIGMVELIDNKSHLYLVMDL